MLQRVNSEQKFERILQLYYAEYILQYCMHFVIMTILQCFVDVLLRSLLTTISQLYVLDAVKWKDDELGEWHLPFLSYITK